MKPDLPPGGPAVEYLLKEVSFSTCDNRFFAELEKEMLIPNNVNINGKVKGATSLKGYRLRLNFPEESVIAYLKQPLANTIEGKERVLTYRLEDLINYEDYWWFPIRDETVFSIALNLLPPFPQLNPVDLSISCRPETAVGLEAYVTTTIRLTANEDIDYRFLRVSAPRPTPGISVAISEYSGQGLVGLQQSVTSPKEEFPFPRQGMRTGQTEEYTVKTRISASPRSIPFLRCEQDALNSRLLMLSDSSPSDLPCRVTVLDGQDQEIPVQRTIRSTVLQATGWIMYSPFSVHRDKITRPQREVLVETPAR